MAKQVRNPKFERRYPSRADGPLSAFWQWADEGNGAVLLLREASEQGLRDEARQLWREAKELNLIFGAIWRKTA